MPACMITLYIVLIFKWSCIPLVLAKETISVLRNFCNHPEKGGKMSQKQSASVVFILKWEKENKLTFRNYII